MEVCKIIVLDKTRGLQGKAKIDYIEPRLKLKVRQVDPFIIEGYSSASLCESLVLGSCLMHIRVHIYHVLSERFNKTK
jgi:hypothetical protein